MPKIKMPNISREYRGLQFMLAMQKSPLAYFSNIANKEGAFVWMKGLGMPLILMLNDAAGIKYVLQTQSDNFCKGFLHQFLKPLFGRSIFLSEKNIWREQRENAAPVFANRHFETMAQQIVDAVEAMFKRWDRSIEANKPIDLTLEMTSFSLDSLLRTLFHEEKSEAAQHMRSTLDVILSDTEDRVWSKLKLPTFIAHKLPKYVKAKRFLNSLVKELIEDRRANKLYPTDLLSRLIEHYQLPGEEQAILNDEVLAYVLAGHDTTSHALCWTFYCLAHNVYHQEHMHNEVKHALDGLTPAFQDLKQLSYTLQIFQEAMRLYPPIWSMSRQAVKDDKIPLDDGSFVDVPAGASVMMCHYAVHRRTKYWDHPDAFDPSRFSPQSENKRMPFTWFPFGAGPRKCIGFRFAEMEAVIAIAMITQRYKLTLLPGQDIKPTPIITLRPSSSMFFRIEKRDVQTNSSEISASDTQPPSAQKCPFHHAA